MQSQVFLVLHACEADQANHQFRMRVFVVVVISVALSKTVRLIVLQAGLFFADPFAILALKSSSFRKYCISIFGTASVLVLLC